ncbi:MAG: hypothetical protein ACI9VR_001427 [Cognaticolwellia sp.]|jgi:hypothetical protein
MLAIWMMVACATEPAQTKDEKAAALTAEAAAVAEEPATPVNAEGWKHWGEDFKVEEITSASALLSDPASFQGKTLRVEGKIGDVCQAKGCWLVLADGDMTMRVMMKDHSFNVDKDIAAQSCQIEGTVTVRELDPEFIEHLASESENPDAMPEKHNAQDGKVYEFEAVAVSSKKS